MLGVLQRAKVIKYLYKYIYNGHDRCVVYIESDEGEKVIAKIQNFQDAHWVTTFETLRRIYEFNLSEMQPSIINFQLHLPNRQSGNYFIINPLTCIVLLEQLKFEKCYCMGICPH